MIIIYAEEKNFIELRQFYDGMCKVLSGKDFLPEGDKGGFPPDEMIKDAIKEDPPLAMKEGGIIRDGYNPEVDKLRSAKSDGKDWLAKLESDEREKTGIKNLKIKYNKVFGYYLEVTNSFKDLVPDYYTRKQTLANAERYIIPELKNWRIRFSVRRISFILWSMSFTVISEAV